MPHRLPNYLRSHRKRWDLSQQELAFLLGLADQGAVSNIELHARVPSSNVFAAAEIIFDVTPRELFPRLYSRTENEVMERALELITRLESRTDLSPQTKLQLLTDVIRRLEGGSTQ